LNSWSNNSDNVILITVNPLNFDFVKTRDREN